MTGMGTQNTQCSACAVNPHPLSPCYSPPHGKLPSPETFYALGFSHTVWSRLTALINNRGIIRARSHRATFSRRHVPPPVYR